MSLIRRSVVAFLVLAAMAAPAAQATYLGENGKIAFTRYSANSGSIWVINPDGSGGAPLVAGDNPSWSADGSKLAYGCAAPDEYSACTANADGSSVNVLSNDGVYPEDDPTWSPDGTKLAVASGNMCGSGCFYTDVWRINAADGTDSFRLIDGGLAPSWSRNGNVVYSHYYANYTYPPTEIHVVNARYPGYSTQLTQADGGTSPDWSPDGTKIAFASQRDGIPYELYTMNADGSNQTRLTTNTDYDYSPSWSPDGTKIVFVRDTGGGYSDLWLMNPDGSGQTRLTDTPGVSESSPAWQPVPQPGYVRPKGATPLRVSLVPAFERCDTPNRVHGPSLAFGSCAPPRQRAGFMVFGGAPTGTSPKSIGHVRLAARVGTSAAGNQADVEMEARLTDVRRASDLSDGPGSLELQVPVRLTDKHNGAYDSEQGTMQDYTLKLEVPCAETADTTIGSTCSATTTANALIPQTPPVPSADFVGEGNRAIWQIDQISVWDGGEDGFLESRDDNTVLAVQGVFVP